MSTTSGSSQGGVPGATVTTVTSAAPGTSVDSQSGNLEIETTSPAAGASPPTVGSTPGPSAGPSSSSTHHASTVGPNQNDELDFEEYDSLEESEDGEDGEVNTEDDLEEGEVVEGDVGAKDETSVQTTQAPDPKKQNKVSVCRFFAKGQCTWGLNCRFLHLAAPVVALPLKLPAQRGFPYQGWFQNIGVQPTGVHPIPRPPLNRHQAAALAGTTVHPPSTSQSSSSNTENAWSRGLRNAKEMIVKANKRKEEENDFDKTFNANAEDEGTSHSKHSHHSRESPESGDYGDRRSPHNYHPRDREKRSHREGNLRDHREPREPREPRESRESREPRESRDLREREREPRNNRDKDNLEREPRDDYWNSEYERRRRLAFEAAPWNDEQSPPPAPSRGSVRPREAAEMYRDPWRRSKSPTAKWSGGRRTDVSTASKRSHSMSSISDSESGSNLSGSESTSVSGDSFSGSEVTFSDASGVSGRSPREKRQKSKTNKSSARTSRHGNKSRPKPTAEQSSHHNLSGERGGPPPRTGPVREKINSVQVSKNRSNRSSMEEEASGNIPRKKSAPVSPPPLSKPRRDSWSDSDSGSLSHSGSSHYSNSESGESDAFSETSDTPLENDRRSKGYRSRRDVKPHPSSVRQNYDSARRVPQKIKTNSSPLPPPSSSSSHHTSNAKRMKMSTSASTSSSSSSREINMKNRHSSSIVNEGPSASTSQQMMSKKSLHTPSSPSDGPKKNPIKMTFKKKHSNLKTDRVITAKLNGGKSNEESGEEEESESYSDVRHRRDSPCADADDNDEEGDEYYEKEKNYKSRDGRSICKKYRRDLSDGEASDDAVDDEEEEEGGDHIRSDKDGFKRENDNYSNFKRGGNNEHSKKSFPSPQSSSKSKKSSDLRSPPSPSGSSKSPASKDSSNRREHLMKQLEAVEAMIAMKKAKLG